MEHINIKTAVLGGGASGHAAAIGKALSSGRGSVMILEKQQKTGRKLLATGSGRCNISNEGVSEKHYHGDRDIINGVISRFSVNDLKAFFGRLGVLLRTDGEGRIYPKSNSASTILDALRRGCARLGVREECSFVTREIKKEKSGFAVISDNMTIHCEVLIAACGSKASPHLGSDGSGLELLEGLGVRHSELFPALCPVDTMEKLKALKGVRAKGSASLTADGKVLRTERGEVQFTEKSVSGICVFELSRGVNEFFLGGKTDGAMRGKVVVSVDLFDDMSFPELCAYLEGCKSILQDNFAGELFSGALNRQLAAYIAKRCGLGEKKCSALTQKDVRLLAGTAKGLTFTPAGMSGFANAQVCAGGVTSSEVFPDTLMSRRHKGLFICGELLDADGDCGGYNLHFAVGSGLLCASAK